MGRQGSARGRCAISPNDGGRDAAGARSGDLEAFNRLYRDLHWKVRTAAYRLIGDEHEAEDTAQDAFLAAYRCLPHLVDPEAFEAWLLRITRNRAVDRGRRMARCRPSVRAHDDSDDRTGDAPRVLRRSGVAEPSPESVAIVRGTFDEMSPPLRETLRLRYEKGLSCEEIARRKGVTVMAVKTRLFRARRALRAALGGEPRGRRRARTPRDSVEKTCVAEGGG
jgi:RNA polymerase sigma-70 factor (ECF subfamily)